MTARTDPGDLAALRRDVARWIHRHHPGDLPHDPAERFARLRSWQRALYEAGWVGIGWPTEYGGHGGHPAGGVVVYQELAAARAPLPVGLIGLDVVGPTIVQFGTHQQKRRHVEQLLRADVVWCQGFSEPDAGSDLASLRTRATVSPEGFRVTGQKVWTSWAQEADWCAVLARTDPAAARHRGISYLLVPMSSPGITVRPLTQMTGDPEFAEVFFEDVAVDPENLLGELHGGWPLAMHTLAHERGPFTLRRHAEIRAALDDLSRLAHELQPGGARLADDALWLHRLGTCEYLVEALGAQGERTLERMAAAELSAESSAEKLLLAEVEQEVHGLALDMLGAWRTTPSTAAPLEDPGRWIHDYLYARASSIYGGTSDIQREIVAARALGLPKAGRA